MKQITIEVSEEYFAKLLAWGKQSGLTVGELLQQWLAHVIDDRDEQVRMAMEYVLEKRADLYRRLADL